MTDSPAPPRSPATRPTTSAASATSPAPADSTTTPASTNLVCDLIAQATDALTLTEQPTNLADQLTRPIRSGVGIVEGWRGTIVHRVELDNHHRITRAKIVDPSWFNWPALPAALTDTIVPDFPLANKSFNLSYAGNDL
jgi:Ni,Fe-hydrogenase III large subunit